MKYANSKPIFGEFNSVTKGMLFTGLLISSIMTSTTLAETLPAKEAQVAPPPPATTAARKVSPYHPVSVPGSARTYYQSIWGIDNLLVHQTASGNLIRFSYRVTDPVRAKPLGDKTVTPYMFGLRSRAVLQVPVMDKVGALRQTSTTPGTGQEYWMVFSNKGNLVKPGDRVNVIIGYFHADGLMVE